MSPTRSDEVRGCPIRSEADLLQVRSVLRTEAAIGGLGTVAETRLVTAGSELARNIIRHARGGSMAVRQVSDRDRLGVRAVFADEGPGIGAIELAMADGWSSAGSLGLGLPGAKRLVDDFGIETGPGGTTVTVTVWAR